MKQDYVILTDSSCDLPPELVRELGLAVLDRKSTRLNSSHT